MVALERSREKGAIAAIVELGNEDRPADRVAQLPVLGGRLRQSQRVVCPTGCVQSPPLLEQVDGAMQVVSAPARRNADSASVGVAIRGVEHSGMNLDLIGGIDGGNKSIRSG